LAAENPYIKTCSILARHETGGIKTELDIVVGDPDGSVPSTIASVTVNGPNGFSYDFVPADYQGGTSNEYWHASSGLPADGQYIFTVTNNNGHTATSFSYLTVGQLIPAPDSSTLHASGTNPLTPTLSWNTILDYPGNLFYRGRILDMAGNTVWTSNTIFNSTSVTVPSGTLTAGNSYKMRFEAFDSSAYNLSNNRGVSNSIPLNIDNTRPYFNIVKASKWRFSNGYVKTDIQAQGGNAGALSSAVVTRPDGVVYVFQPKDCSITNNQFNCALSVNPPLADGNFTFAASNAAGDTVQSYFHMTSYDVPLVDTTTMNASGNPLSPVLSWSAPESVDRPLYYQVFIYSSLNTTVYVWASSSTMNTSISVPQGVLQSGISYVWNVHTYDSSYLYSANISFTGLTPLTINNTLPYFSGYSVVLNRNYPDGNFTGLNVMVGDPNGMLPGSIASLTVTGPDSFSHTFQPSDYSAASGYFYRIPGSPQEGLYTFMVTDNEAKSAVTYHYYNPAGGTIPLLNENSFEVSGDPLAPAISWSTVAGYPYHLYYLMEVIDQQENTVYQSSWSGDTYQPVPTGKLASGNSYRYRIIASDGPSVSSCNNRSYSNYLELPTPPGKATLVSPTGTITTTTPTYTWNAVQNSTQYLLSVNDTTGNKINIWYTAAQASCSAGIGTCSVAPKTALAMGSCTWRIETYNSSGNGPWSDGMVFMVGSTPKVPGKPTGVKATAGNAQAAVTFTAPSSNGGSPITSYTVTSSPGGIKKTGASSPITVTGLTNGKTYTFTVKATNAVGTGPASSKSNSVTLPTVPGKPTGVKATAGNAQATVTFKAPASNGGSPITSYTVTSSPGGIKKTGASSPITVTGLTNGKTYTFTIKATNAVGTGPASSKSNSVTPAK